MGDPPYIELGSLAFFFQLKKKNGYLGGYKVL